MGATGGAGQGGTTTTSGRLWRSRIRRLACAVVAMVAVVLAGSDAVAATPPPGQDVSWPQCSTAHGGYALPMPPASAPFVVVGLTAGRGFTANPCAASQAAWARRAGVPTAAYLVPSYPTRAEKRTYGGRGNVVSVALAVGRAQARHALAVLHASGLHTRVVWIDVEQVTRHPWSSNPDANLAVVRGVAAQLRRAGVTPGLYTNSSSWATIVDDARLRLPEWRTVGPRPRATAQRACSAAPLNGGQVVLVQFWTSHADYDLACPALDARAARLRWFAAP